MSYSPWVEHRRRLAKKKADAQGLSVAKPGEPRSLEDRKEELRRLLVQGEAESQVTTRVWFIGRARGKGSVISKVLRELVSEGEFKEGLLPGDLYRGLNLRGARPMLYLRSSTDPEFYFEGVRERIGLPLRKGNELDRDG